MQYKVMVFLYSRKLGLNDIKRCCCCSNSLAQAATGVLPQLAGLQRWLGRREAVGTSMKPITCGRKKQGGEKEKRTTQARLSLVVAPPSAATASSARPAPET